MSRANVAAWYALENPVLNSVSEAEEICLLIQKKLKTLKSVRIATTFFYIQFVFRNVIVFYRPIARHFDIDCGMVSSASSVNVPVLVEKLYFQKQRKSWLYNKENKVLQWPTKQ